MKIFYLLKKLFLVIVEKRNVCDIETAINRGNSLLFQAEETFV